MSNYKNIAYRVTNQVAYLSHNRPAARNAESQLLLEELDDALRQASADPDVVVIVLDAVGDHFSAGHDLKEAQTSRANFTVEERWDYEEVHYLEYALRIWDCPKPTIAQVQGACVSGGFMVANMCDLIIAADDAFFSDPVVHTLGAAAVEILVHPYVLGLRKAKEFLFTGARLSAEEAFRIGMVNKVVPRSELEKTTEEMARSICQAPPFALKLIKRSLNRAADMQGFRSAINAHFDTHQLSHTSEAFKRARDKGLANAIRSEKA